MASGIHRYLKDAGASWPDKLKVARYAWVTESCYIPNKYQVLLNWSCHAISHGDFSHEDGTDHLAGLWAYIKEIIQSRAFCQESLTVPATFYNALHKTLLTKRAHNSDVLQVTQELFKQPQLCSKLLAKADSSIDILSSLLLLLRRGNTNEENLPTITQHALQVFAEKYKFRVINRKVFEDITEKVLLSCLCLHHQSDVLPLREAIKQFLSETLFSEDLMPRYEDFLQPKMTFESATSVQKMVESVSNSMMLMKKVLISETMNKETEGVLSGIPLLYKLFISSLKPRPEMSFLMMKKYLEVLGFSETKELWEGSECQRSSVMGSVRSLLLEVCNNEIFSVLDDQASGGNGKSYLKHLTKQVIALDQWGQPSWYSSIQLIFSLDYNLLVKHQCTVLRAAISSPSTADGNHDNSTNKLCEAKLAFLTEVASTYLRMRQFPVFCNFLIRSCGLEDCGYSLVQLPPKFLSLFGSMVQTLPLQMSLSIWTALKTALSNQTKDLSSVLLQTDANNPPPSKKMKKIDPVSISLNHLESLGVLLGTFVRNCKVVEFSGLPHGASAVRALLQEMVSDIIVPSMEALCALDNREYDDDPIEDYDAFQLREPLAFTTFFVTSCHGDVRLLLYNFLRDSGDVASKENSFDWLPLGKVSRIHGYLSGVTWDKVHATCSLFGSGRVEYLRDALLLQQVKLLILLPGGDGQESVGSLASLTSTLCRPSSAIDHFQTWPGTPHTITGDNYQTAQLSLMTRHYPLLSPHMTEFNRSDFAVLVCKGLFSNDGLAANGGGVAADGGSMDSTGRALALKFLLSDVCMESRELHNVLVSKSIQELSAVMDRGLAREFYSTPTQRTPDDLNLARVLSDPSGLHRYIKQVRSGHTLKEHYYRYYEAFIKVLSTVPTKSLSVDNQTHCLLSLHAIDSHLTSAEGAPTKETLRLLTDVRQLIVEFIRVVPKTDLLSQVNLKALINDLVTSHLMFNERVLKDQSDVSCLVSLLEVNRHTSELLSHWLRRESLWSGGTSHCIKSVMKKLKSSMEANIDSALNHVVLVDLAAVVLKHAGKHTASLPPNFGDYSSNFHHFLKTSIGQISSAARRPSLAVVFSISAISNFFLHVHDVKTATAADGAASEYEKALTDLGATRRSWTEHVLSFLPKQAVVIERDGASSLMGVASEQTLKLIRSMCVVEDVRRRVWSCLYELLGVYGASPELLETMKSILPRMEDEYFQQHLEEAILSIRSVGHDLNRCTASLRLWQVLPYAQLRPDQLQAVSSLMPQLVEQSTLLVQELDPGISPEMISLTFESLACVIDHGKDLLDEETAVSSLSLCLLLKLDLVPSESFSSVFQSVSRLVNSLLQTFPKSAQKSSHSYIAVLQHLLRSLMRRGQQNSEDSIPDDQLTLCAEDMERLLSCFGSFKETKQVACFLLATFFQDLQEGTLLPFVKKILVLGMYHLVGSADFKSLDSVQSTMPGGLREIYKAFIEGFHKDHRFKGNI